MDASLRPMSTSQVLDRTFYLYRKNFALFVGIAIVGPALSLIASFVQLGMFGIPVMPAPGQFDPVFLEKLIVQSIVTALLGLVLYTIGQALATGATMHAVSMVHLAKTTTIWESYQTIKPVLGRILSILVRIYFRAFWPIAVAYILMLLLAFGMVQITRAGAGTQVAAALIGIVMFMIVFAGMIGGLIWSVYVYCRYSLAIPACVLEKLPAKDSLARSKFLAAGSLGRIIAIYLLTFVMSAVLTSVLQIPAYLSMNPFNLKSGAHITTAFVFWTTLGGFIGRTLAGPIATIAVALIYYDQRVRKEAFDLQLMMEALGQPAPPPLVNPAVPGLG